MIHSDRCFSEKNLDDLRQNVERELSPKRFRHVAAVEEMVARLAALYCPEQTMTLRAAALLHDVTKEWTVEQHASFCEAHGVRVSKQDCVAFKTLHARTAAMLIPERFPQFSDPTVIDAVRWHTTGHKGMTLTEKLLYLADYIDLSRTFRDCVTLRNFFFDADPEHLDAKKRKALLRDTLILSFDMTIEALISEGQPIAEDTVKARNELVLECATEKRENT